MTSARRTSPIASLGGVLAILVQLVRGIVRFYDMSSLPVLVEDQGLTVVECSGEPCRVTMLARA